MIFRVTQQYTKTKRGADVLIDKPFFAKFKKPRGGWAVRMLIKGTTHTITGENGRDVFNQCSRLLSTNSIEVSDLDLWYSLNHQWLNRSDESVITVDLDYFNSLSLPPTKEQDGSPKERVAPEKWARSEWLHLGNYLATDPDSYRHDDFLKSVEITLMLLNPAKSSRIGCQVCYSFFASKVASLRFSPIYDIEEARRWLWGVHNEVNIKLDKPVLTYDEAATINNWF